MKRALLLLPAVALAAGCASGHPRTTTASQRQPARVALHLATRAENEAAARHDAERLLRTFRLPAGSRPTHWRRGHRSSRGFLQLARAWRVPRPLAQVQAFLAAHDSRTGRLPGIGGPATWRWLVVRPTALPDGATAVRVLVQEQYLLPLPRRDRVPASVNAITVRSHLGKRPLASARVTDPEQVRRIVAWFDRLGRVPHDQGCLLLLRGGPTVTVVFRGANGRVVARAIATDTGPVLTGCDGFQLSVGQRTAIRVVGGDVLRRIQRLLGLSFDRPRTQTAPGCPAKVPRLGRPSAAGRYRLVRPGAVSLAICRYSGLNAPHPSSLVRSRRIVDAATINSLTRELDALHRTPHGTYYCPMDDGSAILLVFGYADGGTERVTVALLGCQFVTNGRISRFDTPRLRARLLALSRGRAGAS